MPMFLIHQHADHAARVARFSLTAVRAARATLIDPDDEARGTVQARELLGGGGGRQGESDRQIDR